MSFEARYLRYVESLNLNKGKVTAEDIHIPDLDENLEPIKTKVILVFNFDIDFKFWAIMPAINLNFHSSTFEFEFLCFAIYIDKKETL